MRYIALLRGINVGGKQIIRMAELRECVAKLGFDNIGTYIQSGNLVFTTNRTAVATLEEQIATALQKEFGYKGWVHVITAARLQQIVEEAPARFVEDKKTLLCDIIFVHPPLKPQKLLETMELREGIDQADAGTYAVYISRDLKRKSRSRFGKIAQHKQYKNITIRNCRTTNAILDMAI